MPRAPNSPCEVRTVSRLEFGPRVEARNQPVYIYIYIYVCVCVELRGSPYDRLDDQHAVADCRCTHPQSRDVLRLQ